MLKTSAIPRPLLLSGLVLISVLLVSCASTDQDLEPTPLPTETSNPTVEPTDEPSEPQQPAGWNDLSVDERCAIILEQLPGTDVENQVPLENFLLGATLHSDLAPDCVIDTESGTLPTQVSIYLEGYVGLKDEIVKKLEDIEFYPSIQDFATLSSLASQEAPGSILVEHFEADALLEFSAEAQKFDLTGLIFVLITANYDPNFDADDFEQGLSL